jgi:AcrR family transcriptional regulator
VLQAALEMIAEDGLDAMTMAALGKRLGTSGGHILYYFGSKDLLLVETLRWSESRLGERRRELLARPDSAFDRLAGYIGLYLPEHRADPRWTVWLAVYGRALGNAEVLDAAQAMERPWADDLSALLTEAGAGDDGLDAFITGLHAMLDGFALQIVTGVPGADRAGRIGLALDHARLRLSGLQ